MFDIGWSELVVIAVVALIAIGPKELPGVLRMVGQWMGKARKMAAEFQGQFQEAMREAEMADLKKSFDEVKEAATGFHQRQCHDLAAEGRRRRAADRRHRQAAADSRRCAGGVRDRRARHADDAGRADAGDLRRGRAHAAASEPLAITREVQAAPQDIAPAAPDVLKDAKAS